MTGSGWDHANSTILHGIEKVNQRHPNSAYVSYIKAYADAFVNDDGSIKGLRDTLDGMHPGVVCLFLYEQTGDVKYKRAAQTMRDYFVGTAQQASPFHKTPDGGYWHKNNEKYSNVMSVDGTYMVYPFLVHYAVMFKEPALLDLAAAQILLAHERSFNIKAQLPYHAWNYDKTKPWANPITGTSSQFWSRASGWSSMALVDVLEYFPKDHPSYGRLLFLFQQFAEGLKSAQNPVDGLWYQVLDSANKPDNYPEASGSGMITYALQKGVNLNLLDGSYAKVAAKGWQGLQLKIKTYKDGGPQITSVAPAMGSQSDYAGYVAIRPINLPSDAIKQDPHGYIGVLMAASVMEPESLHEE
jgi:unsaturated rhamnogalacturonyl hydrolase